MMFTVTNGGDYLLSQYYMNSLLGVNMKCGITEVKKNPSLSYPCVIQLADINRRYDVDNYVIMQYVNSIIILPSSPSKKNTKLAAPKFKH